MEPREFFFDAIIPVIFKYGPKSVTMDDIAKTAAVSKKTLYKFYTAKEDILQEMMHHLLGKIITNFKNIQALSLNPVEELIKFMNLANFFIEKKDNVFGRQMYKYYPEVVKAHQLYTYGQVRQIFEINFQRGASLGLYDAGADYDMNLRFLLLLFFSIDGSPLFSGIDDAVFICEKNLEFYLRSIVTVSGLEKFLEIKKNHSKI